MAQIYNELVSAQLENLSSDPTSATGKVYFNTTNFRAKYYNGSTWKEVLEEDSTQAVINKTQFSVDNITFDGSTISSASGDIILAPNGLGRTEVFTPFSLLHNSTPTPPPAGYLYLYAKSDNNLYLQNSAGTESAITSGAATVFADTSTFFQDDLDTSKKFRFDLSGLTTGITRSYQVPDADTTLLMTDAAQDITGKTILDIGSPVSLRVDGSTISRQTADALLSFTYASGVLKLNSALNLSYLSTPGTNVSLQIYAKSDDLVYKKTIGGVESLLGPTLASTSSYRGTINPYGGVGVVLHGTWTPTYTNGSSTSAFSNIRANYVRIGRIVTCFGAFTLTTSSSSAFCYLTLPVTPSAFPSTTDGSRFAGGVTQSGTVMRSTVGAEPSGTRALFNFSFSGTYTYTYYFTYYL